MKINRELLKGSTELLVLTVLDIKPMYGYEMIKELKIKTENVFEFQEGTIYPILHKLEEKKYISSYWEDVDGKNRKYYSITKEGKKQLSSKKEEWKIFSSSINSLIGGALFEY
jgi:DNA-binding PadR family transcriptional regulator